MIIKSIPCNVCGGDVEIKCVGFNDYLNECVFNLKCLNCGQRVISGRGFAMELKTEGEKRISEYWKEMKHMDWSLFFDDITWCGNECSHTECERNQVNMLHKEGLHSFAMFKDTEMCPLYKGDEKDGQCK